MELEERDFLIHTKFDIEDGYIFKHPLVSGNHLQNAAETRFEKTPLSGRPGH